MTTVIGSSECGAVRSSLADTSAVQERNLFCCSVPPMTTVSPAKTMPGKNRKETTIRHLACIQNENCCPQFTEDLLATTWRARQENPVRESGHLNEKSPNGGRFVARCRGVWREPYRPSMEWTCDVRETWLTRQRIERGRFTGPCNRKIRSPASGRRSVRL